MSARSPRRGMGRWLVPLLLGLLTLVLLAVVAAAIAAATGLWPGG